MNIQCWVSRAQPHLVDVVHLTAETDWWATAWWCRGSLVDSASIHAVTIVVQTLRGPERACIGDYIVQRGPGDFLVVGPEEFYFAYQPHDEDGDEL